MRPDAAARPEFVAVFREIAAGYAAVLKVAYRGDDGAPRTLYIDRQYNATLALMH